MRNVCLQLFTFFLLADPYLLRGHSFGLDATFASVVRKSATPPFIESDYTCRFDQVTVGHDCHWVQLPPAFVVKLYWRCTYAVVFHLVVLQVAVTIIRNVFTEFSISKVLLLLGPAVGWVRARYACVVSLALTRCMLALPTTG